MRVTHLRQIALLAAAASFATQLAYAADDTPEHGTISVLFENDVFYNTDRDYTNGVQFAYTSGPDDNFDTAVRVARLLPFFSQDGVVRTDYALGQNIYTPADLKAADPPITQRPYAGFLYGALGLIDETDTHIDQIQLQLGVVGPDSLAEQTQDLVHRIIHDTIPQGWSYQLHNEPALVLTDERAWRAFESGSLFGLAFDIDPHVGGAVGNVYDYVNAGAMGRIGFNLPDDYGPPRIEPSQPGSNFFEPTGDIGGYLFAGVDGRAIARNIFLDGNTWDPSRHVDKIPFVADLQLGAALTFNSFRLTFTHVFRSREYTTQQHSDQFGAINLSYRY